MLAAVGETETSVQVVKKHLLLYSRDVLEPRGIHFEEKRTGSARLLVFQNDNLRPCTESDTDDANDANDRNDEDDGDETEGSESYPEDEDRKSSLLRMELEESGSIPPPS